MSGDSEFPLRELLGLPEEEPEEPTAFAKSVSAALTDALAAMRREGVVEVEDENLAALTAELTAAAVEARSLKRLLRRVVDTLVNSTRVEEVYGTDEELSTFFRRFFENG